MGGWGGGGKSSWSSSASTGGIKDTERTVWLGQLPEGATYQEVLELAKQVGNAKWAEILGSKGGSAVVGFATAEEAKAAITALSGAQLGSATLVADTYTKKKWGSGSDGQGWGGGGGSNGKGWGGSSWSAPAWKVQKPQFEKSWNSGGSSWNSGGSSWNSGKGDGKGWGKGNGWNNSWNNKFVNPEKTLWVGEVPEGATFKEILELAKQVGNAKWAEVLGKGGTAAIGFGSAEEAQAAVSALNGTVFGSSTLVVDLWDRKKKE